MESASIFPTKIEFGQSRSAARRGEGGGTRGREGEGAPNNASKLRYLTLLYLTTRDENEERGRELYE